jgi:Icc-related predicted phosphoesterase
MRAFIDWFAALQIPNKVFVAGNHDTSVEKGLVSRELMTSRGITYLQDEEATFGGLRIWGAPWTPTYGDWSFMRGRHKMHSIWSSIPEGIDILATHGPPYGVLDATYSQNNRVELCGDVSLMKRVQELQPQLVCFGHIHSTDDIRNAGTRTVHGLRTIFSNGSCVDDGKWGIITSHGNVIDI